jgi:hypothetical protein
MRKSIAVGLAMLFLSGCNHADQHDNGLARSNDSARLAAVEERLATLEGRQAVSAKRDASDAELSPWQALGHGGNGHMPYLRFELAHAKVIDGNAVVVFRHHRLFHGWADLSIPVDGAEVRAISADGKAISPLELPKRLAKRSFVGVVLFDQRRASLDLSSYVREFPEDGIVFCVPSGQWKRAEDTQQFFQRHARELSDAAASR